MLYTQTRPTIMRQSLRFLSLGLITGFMLLLSACGTSGGGTTPTLTVSPTNPEVTVGGAAINITASLTGSSDTITWTLNGRGAISANTGAAIQYTPPTSGAAGSATLSAIAGPLSQQVFITIAEPPATIDNIEIDGYGSSTQVRQGAGSIRIVATGTNLDNVARATIDDLTNITIRSNNSNTVTLDAVVEHGVDLGGKTLTLNAEVGPVTRSNAVTVTAITAGPGGSDDTRQGTPDAPFRTLTSANGFATGGDTVRLLDGSYTEADGETWPLNLSSGILLEGSSQSGTILQGPGGSTSTDGLTANGGAMIKDLTVRDFRYGVYSTSATADIEVSNVSLLNNNQYGFYHGFSTPMGVSLNNVRTEENGGMGIYVHNASAAELDGVTATNNSGTGIYLSLTTDASDPAMATVNAVNSVGNSGFGFYMGSSGSSTLRATVSDIDVSDSGSYGVYIEANGSSTLEASLSNITTDETSSYGMYLTGGGTPILDLDTVSISNSDDYGIYMGSRNGRYNLTNVNVTDTDGTGMFAFPFRLELSSTTIERSEDDGLYVGGDGVTIMDSVTIRDNGNGSGDNGMEFYADQLRMRNTTITDSYWHAFYVGSNPTSVDLGTSTDPANNTFSVSDTNNWLLYDDRNSITTVVTPPRMTAIGTVLGSRQGSGGIRTGTDQEVDTTVTPNIYMWRINGTNQTILFPL